MNQSGGWEHGIKNPPDEVQAELGEKKQKTKRTRLYRRFSTTPPITQKLRVISRKRPPRRNSPDWEYKAIGKQGRKAGPAKRNKASQRDDYWRKQGWGSLF